MLQNLHQIIREIGRRALANKFVLLLAITGSQAFAQQESIPQLIKRIKPSVVAIITLDAKGEPPKPVLTW